MTRVSPVAVAINSAPKNLLPLLTQPLSTRPSHHRLEAPGTTDFSGANNLQKYPTSNSLLALSKHDLLVRSVQQNLAQVPTVNIINTDHLTSTPVASSEQLFSPVSLPKPSSMYFVTNGADSQLVASRLAMSSEVGGNQKENEPKQPNLEKISHLLSFDLHNFFVRACDYSYYRHDIVLEDNIRGKRLEGIVKYRNAISLMKILCHFRFVYVRFHILGITEHPEDGTVRIRWRIAGMGMIKMCLKYFPAQMWKRGNLDKAADTWYDGYSTFYVDNDDKIYKHRADKVMPDEDREPVSVKKQLAEKLQKLKPQAAPAL